MHSVSVIIPTWNRAHTLRAAIDSVLQQTQPVLEVLICDDGSTDNSREIVTSYPSATVKWIEGPRAGRPAIPRNRGIKAAKGEWIALLDSDDTWLPEKIDIQMKRVAAAGTSAVCSNAYRAVPGKGRVGAYLNNSANSFALPLLLRTNFIICSSACIRRDVIASCGYFPEEENLKAIEDFALWLRVATKTDFTYCQEPLIEYTDDAANSIRVDAKENLQREHVMRNFYEWCTVNGVESNRKEIRNAVRLAMKNNGKSFFERLKVK